MSVYKVEHRAITIADSTTVEVKLPHGSKEHLFRISDSSVAYAWGVDESVVTAGNGFPMLAGEATTFVAPLSGSSVYFRQTSGGPLTLHWGYLYPAVR